jgi:hypothetical protein
VYGPDKAKVPLPTASPEEVLGWALRTVGVSQRNADKLLEQEIDGADIVHLSKLPESELEARFMEDGLSRSAALKLSVAISDFGAAATGTCGVLLLFVWTDVVSFSHLTAAESKLGTLALQQHSNIQARKHCTSQYQALQAIKTEPNTTQYANTQTSSLNSLNSLNRG